MISLFWKSLTCRLIFYLSFCPSIITAIGLSRNRNVKNSKRSYVVALLKAIPPSEPPWPLQAVPEPASTPTSTSSAEVTPSNVSVPTAVFSILVILGLLATLIILVLAIRKWKKWIGKKKSQQGDEQQSDNPQENQASSEVYLSTGGKIEVFNASVLCAATGNFCNERLLGRGGFGEVFKGSLVDGREMAVKRLRRASTYEHKQFKAEVRSLAVLEHVNLVKLIGYCKEGEERLLCYEYLPNGSLDKHMFGCDRGRDKILSWGMRCNIIDGICEGLTYLHGTVKLVHRDLKPDNILLDEQKRPKISDFGTARFFEDEQTNQYTMYPIFTRAYVAPEYLSDGKFSFSSDVYSFGVILLEIVTGQRSTPPSNNVLNLIGKVVQNWLNGTVDQLKDENMGEAPTEDIKKYIQIGLCCVDSNSANRPKMRAIKKMLEGELEAPEVSGTFLNIWKRAIQKVLEGKSEVSDVSSIYMDASRYDFGGDSIGTAPGMLEYSEEFEYQRHIKSA